MKPQDSSPKDNVQKDPIKEAIEKNPCSICRKFGIPVCMGHGNSVGGVAGGQPSSGGSGSSKAINADNQDSVPNLSQKIITATISASSGNNQNNNKWLEIIEKNLPVFNFEKVKAIASIESNHITGTLTIRPKPGLTKEDLELLQEFLNVVKLEFASFKNKLDMQGVSVKDFAISLKDNSLTLSIPNHKFYNDFIGRVINKNLALIENLTQQKNKTNEASQTFNPTPLSTKLTPKNSKKNIEELASYAKPFNPTPLSNKLKPKGFKE